MNLTLRSRGYVTAASLAAFLAAAGTGVTATAAGAATAPAPLSAVLSASSDGASATWNSGGDPVLKLGSVSSGTYAEATVTSPPALDPKAPEPTFSTDNYAAGSPRWVITLSNGKSLWGYPPNSKLNGPDFAWAVDNGNTYTSYSAALAAAGVTAATAVKSVQIVADGDQADGVSDTITDASYDGRPVTGSAVSTVSGRGGIRNFYSGKCMDVPSGRFAGGTGIQQWTCGAVYDGIPGADQNFQFVTYSNGSVHTGYLEAISPAGQVFYVTPAGHGQLELTTARTTADDMAKLGSYYTFPNAGVVADDSGWSKANGAMVIGYPKTGGANQQWSMP